MIESEQSRLIMTHMWLYRTAPTYIRPLAYYNQSTQFSLSVIAPAPSYLTH